MTAIIGPSGCGKSTFIRCLNRMHEVGLGAKSAGRVWLDQQDVYAHDVEEGRREMNLTALERLPVAGAHVIALPMKIRGGSGAPLRAVAILPR